jgi:hypothetical protein
MSACGAGASQTRAPAGRAAASQIAPDATRIGFPHTFEAATSGLGVWANDRGPNPFGAFSQALFAPVGSGTVEGILLWFDSESEATLAASTLNGAAVDSVVGPHPTAVAVLRRGSLVLVVYGGTAGQSLIDIWNKVS